MWCTLVPRTLIPSRAVDSLLKLIEGNMAKKAKKAKAKKAAKKKKK
jgi:hypothetical protein